MTLDRSERPALRACRALKVSAENRARSDLQDPKVRLDRSERPALRACRVLRVLRVSVGNRASPDL